jgi:hypothetical protein
MMNGVIGTGIIVADEDGVENVSFDFSADFLERSLPERIGSLYLLIDALYDFMDNDLYAEEEVEEEEEDEFDLWEEEDLA